MMKNKIRPSVDYGYDAYFLLMLDFTNQSKLSPKSFQIHRGNYSTHKKMKYD